MDAKKFLEEARRMCEAQEDCKRCPITGQNEVCMLYECPEKCGDDTIDKTIETVEKWSQEHPQKTRLMDFLKKYPNAPTDENGIPTFMPWSLGYCGDTPCYACEKAKGKSPRWCWAQEVEEK